MLTKEQVYFMLSNLGKASVSMQRKIVEFIGDVEELTKLQGEDLFSLGLTPSFQLIEQWNKLNQEEVILEKWAEMEKKGIKFVSMESPDYPKRLKRITDAPIGLFVRGQLPKEELKTAAIIGARKCTNYGKEMAHFFGKELSNAGIQVVSGMALGIDGFAGRGALSNPFHSFAILGNGVDICYPRENLELYEHLTKEGGIISERPVSYYAHTYDFPLRNRIISGLSDVVLVIEAAVHSGSLITVNQALEQGKDIFAMPGRIGDYQSSGCNELIKNGAQVLTCPEDILQHLGMSVEKETKPKVKVTLTKEENIVFQLIGTDPVLTDYLLSKTNLPLGSLLQILLQLEMKGLIRKTGVSGYVKV